MTLVLRTLLCALLILAPMRAFASISLDEAGTIAEVGRTRVIVFHVEPSDADRTFVTRASDDAMLGIESQARVLAGESIGYVRVRGLASGTTTLTIGEQSMPIRVTTPRTPPMTPRPVLTGVTDGAAAWGVIAVGMECFEDPDHPLRGCALVVGENARVLEPERHTPSELGPWRRAWFRVTLSDVKPGPLTLTPRVIDADGRTVEGDPVTLRVVKPGASDVSTFEAEDAFDVERPERFRDDRRSIGRDASASGGAFFANSGAYPAVCVPLNVNSPGWHQMAIIASGSLAGGALPTVGVVVDGAPQPVTNGRLVASGWHRIVVGTPFRLDAGDHVLTPFFTNDFYAPGLADRNLRIDRIEIARIGDADPPVAADPNTMAMMSAMMTAESMMSMGGDDARSATPIATDPYGVADQPLRVAFAYPLHGRRMTGMMQIDGVAAWVNENATDAPLVELIINGESAMSQRSGSPRFLVDAAHFEPGDNRIQLRATMRSGYAVHSAEQTVRGPAPNDDAVTPRRFERFTAHDDAWRVDRVQIRPNDRVPEKREIRFNSNGSASVILPPDMIGTYEVSTDAQGEHFRGAPIVKVTLHQRGRETLVNEGPVPTWWGPHRVGEVNLTPGPKRLTFAFTNDLYEEGVGDRNMAIQSVMLLEARAERDRRAPVVQWIHPPDGADVWAEGVAIVEGSDDDQLVYIDLLIDDVETGMGLRRERGPGLTTLPLLLRDLTPGRHTLMVRARDEAGNVTLSEPRSINVLAAEPDAPTAYHRALRVANRFAFGPDMRTLAGILTMGERDWLDAQLSASMDDPGERAALEHALTLFTVRASDYHASARALTHAMFTPHPARARFVLWAENHFSTWARKTGGARKWDEHVMFSRLGASRFSDLLAASATSPAMLNYLDQETSFAGRINENYAREIMELHTLGVEGAYDQADVTALAHLLAGWTASTEGDGRSPGDAREYTFRFDPRLNDGAARTVVGMRFDEASPATRYDRIRQALETLAAHPDTARHVSHDLASHYISTPPPEGVVNDLSRVYMRTGGDLKAMLLAIVEHPEFHASPERLARPSDYALRTARVSGMRHPWALQQFLDSSGARLFDRSTPDGYPEEDAAWADSNALVQRWRLARQAEWNLFALIPEPWRDGRDVQPIIDALAIRITGRLLSETSNRAALDYIRGLEGEPRDRMLAAAVFVAQLPEANLR